MRLCLILVASLTFAQTLSLRSVPPHLTAPGILSDGDHQIHSLPGPLPQSIMVFLPGTNAEPNVYRTFSRTIASWGVPVVNLSYYNPRAIGIICAGAADLNCFETTRTEVITGDNLSPLIEVDKNNSIDNRLLKLLEYLNREEPTRGWSAFYRNGTILWHKIIIAGHSQGGGHAGLIAKLRLVRRSLMFAAMDYSAVQRRVAPWMERPGLTPPSGFFTFQHEQDELIPFIAMSTLAWPALGINRFGPPALAESSTPIINTRTARSSADVPAQVSPHSIIVTDLVIQATPTVRQGLERIWRYMLFGMSATATNSASYSAIAIAPSMLTAIFAEGLTTTPRAIRVGNKTATLFAAARNQANAILPADLPLGFAAIELEAASGDTFTGTIEVQPSNPGIFTKDFSGQGQAAATWVDNILVLYGTGWRNEPITVTLAGETMRLLYGGPQPEFPGLDQINVKIPARLRNTTSPLEVSTPGGKSNPVSLP